MKVTLIRAFALVIHRTALARNLLDGGAMSMMLIALTGCAVMSTVPAEKEHHYEFSRTSECQLPCKFPLWYGTNRQPDKHGSSLNGFKSGVDTVVHYGKIYVTVPKGHDSGSIGSNFFVRFLTGVDDRITLAQPVAMTQEAFVEDLRQQLSLRLRDERTILVYLHGYNTSFDGAAKIAGQIAFDVRFPGPVAFFSWPSKNEFVGYWDDEKAIAKSVDAIEDFLLQVSKSAGEAKVHLIAHSMGNRALMLAMDRILKGAQAKQVKFGQVVLAAPDVAITDFQYSAPSVVAMANQTTLYVSKRDVALALSVLAHGEARAGYFPPVTKSDNITTISVSKFDLSLLGHGYVASSLEVMRDLKELFSTEKPVTNRLFLRKETDSDGKPYWVFQ